MIGGGMTEMAVKKVVVAITGASGAIYGIRLLEVLRACPDVETHLIISEIAEKVIVAETSYELAAVVDLADYHYNLQEIEASVASGSYPIFGMVVIPCSMKTLASIAHGYANNLITRVADVMLKEKRRLIITPRETPLSQIHLRNMLTAAQAGADIVPLMPAFYYHPESIDDLINHLVGRVLDQLEVPHSLIRRWGFRY